MDDKDQVFLIFLFNVVFEETELLDSPKKETMVDWNLLDATSFAYITFLNSVKSYLI
jgi:hypothetical protein